MRCSRKIKHEALLRHIRRTGCIECAHDLARETYAHNLRRPVSERSVWQAVADGDGLQIYRLALRFAHMLRRGVVFGTARLIRDFVHCTDALHDAVRALRDAWQHLTVLRNRLSGWLRMAPDALVRSVFRPDMTQTPRGPLPRTLTAPQERFPAPPMLFAEGDDLLEKLRTLQPVTRDTADGIRRWADALGLAPDDPVRVTFVPPGGRSGMARRWRVRHLTNEGVLRFMRHMNARGHNVYVNANAAPVVCLDFDSEQRYLAGVEYLCTRGLEPCAVVRSSRGRYHVWIRIAPDPVPRTVLDAVHRFLTDRTGADPAHKGNPAGGRLPGFTNRNHPRTPDRCDWVTLVYADARVASRGPALVREFARRVDVPQTHATPAGVGIAIAPLAPEKLALARRVYARLAEVVQRNDVPRRPDGTVDASAVDGRIAQFLAQRGYAAEHIAAVLRGRPDLLDKKRKPDDYCLRTVRFGIEHHGPERPPEPWLAEMMHRLIDD